MQIKFDDIELFYLITSGKSQKYRGQQGKARIVEQLKSLYQILHTIDNLNQLKLYKSIKFNQVKDSLTFLLPLNETSGLLLKTNVRDGIITFLSLQIQKNNE